MKKTYNLFDKETLACFDIVEMTLKDVKQYAKENNCTFEEAVPVNKTADNMK